MTGPSTSQPGSAHPLVAVVARLRQLHHDAPADERSDVAVLLALALTDLSLALTPNDPMLARTAAEGIAVLAAFLGETAAVTDNGPAAESDRLRHLRLAEAVLHWRAAPTGSVDDPADRLEALLLQPIPPRARQLAQAARLALAARTAKEPDTQAGPPMGLWGMLPPEVDLGKLRKDAQQALSAAQQLPPHHPLRARLLLAGVMGPLTDAMTEQRWSADLDAMLSELMATTGGCNVPPGAPIPLDLAMVTMMRGARCAMATRTSPTAQSLPPATVAVEELDTVIAELDSLLTGPHPPDPSGMRFDVMLRSLLVMLLTTKASRGEDGPPGSAARQRTDELLARAQEQLDQLPPQAADELRSTLALLRVHRDGAAATPADLQTVVDFTSQQAEWTDAGGGALPRVMSLVDRAQNSRRREDIDAAVDAAREFLRGLAPGHALGPQVLAALTHLLGMRASITMAGEDVADAVDAGVQACRQSLDARGDAPGMSACTVMPLTEALLMAAGIDLRTGPFAAAEQVLADVQATDPTDPQVRWSVQIGLGVARLLQWRGTRDPDLLHRAHTALARAEHLITGRQPDPDAVTAAASLMIVHLSNVGFWTDQESARAGRRILPYLEQALDADPALADQLAGRVAHGGLARLGLPADRAGLRQSLRQVDRLFSSFLAKPSAAGPSAAFSGPHPLTGMDTAQWLLDAAREDLLSQAPGTPLDLNRMITRVTDFFHHNPDKLREALRHERGFLTDPAPAEPPAEPRPEQRPEQRPERLASRGITRVGAILTAQQHQLRPLSQIDVANARDGVADLRAALAAGLDRIELRAQAYATLGQYLLQFGSPDEPSGSDALAEGVAFLERATCDHAPELPTPERAELLGLLANGYRRLATSGRGGRHGQATRTARAALREWFRCVLIAGDTTAALQIAARSFPITRRAIAWELADDRPETAVELAESGRSLVLAAVLLAGRLRQWLIAQGRPELAQAWEAGDVEELEGAFREISATIDGQAWLMAPSFDQISQLPWVTGIDAVVYLVPPPPSIPDDAGSGESLLGHAIAVRGAGRVEVLPLPGLAVDASSPLGVYRSWQSAVAVVGGAYDQSRAGGPPDLAAEPLESNEGTWPQAGDAFAAAQSAWEEALDHLGRWAHDRIIAPLTDAARRWVPSRLPHLVLIPLAELGGVPFAAAWTPDGQLPGGRRYAVHDLVLSYAASSRVLADTGRRTGLPVDQRVVLVANPTGDLPSARACARLVHDHLFPGAEVYDGRLAGSADPDDETTANAGTAQRILDALPGTDRPGASVLHLATHAGIDPFVHLAAADRWLCLDEVLDHARVRAVDAPAGLVICDACVSDVMHAEHEDALTLTTAFLARGAKHAIGTRWPMDDTAAAVLTYRLHHHLRSGLSAPYALRAAQLDLINAGAGEPLLPLPDEEVRGAGLDPDEMEPDELSQPVSWAGYAHHGG